MLHTQKLGRKKWKLPEQMMQTEDSWYTADALAHVRGSGVEKYPETERVQSQVVEGRLLERPIGVRACVNLRPRMVAGAAVVEVFPLESTVGSCDEKGVENFDSDHSCSGCWS